MNQYIVFSYGVVLLALLITLGLSFYDKITYKNNNKPDKYVIAQYITYSLIAFVALIILIVIIRSSVSQEFGFIVSFLFLLTVLIWDIVDMYLHKNDKKPSAYFKRQQGLLIGGLIVTGILGFLVMFTIGKKTPVVISS
jgi:hypothetical protein